MPDIGGRLWQTGNCGGAGKCLASVTLTATCPTGVRCATLSSGAWTDIGARAAAGSAQWAVVRSLVLSTAVAQLAAKAGGGGTESGCAGGPREAAGEGAETRGGTERGADAVAEAEAAVLTGAADAWDRLQEELLAVALARMQVGLFPQHSTCDWGGTSGLGRKGTHTHGAVGRLVSVIGTGGLLEDSCVVS